MKAFLPALFFCSFVSGLNAQIDTLYPNGGARWIVGTHTWDGIGEIYGHYKCEITTLMVDTLGFTWNYMIDEQNSNVGLVTLDGPSINYLSIEIMDFGEMQTFYFDGVYEIYKFDLEPGDTAYYRDGYAMVVDSINFENPWGVPRRTFHMSHDFGESDVWIQGIGSIHGFFHPVFSNFESSDDICSFTGDYIDSLNQPYNIVHGNPVICESIGIATTEESEIAIYPNPFSDYTTLYFRQALTNLYHITIHDQLGHLICSINEVTGSSLQIQRNQLNTGIYFLSLTECGTENLVYKTKLIVR